MSFYLRKLGCFVRCLDLHLLNDTPFILLIIVVQAMISAINPIADGSVHFAKLLFFIAITKAFWIGIVASLISFGKIWIKRLLFLLHVLLFDIYLFLVIQFGVRINPFVLSLVFQTTPQEAGEFFGAFFPASLIFLLIISTSILLLLYYFIHRLWKRIFQKRMHKRIERSKTLTAFAIFSCYLIASLTSFSLNSYYYDPLEITSPTPDFNEPPVEPTQKQTFSYVQILYDTNMSYIDIYNSLKVIMHHKEENLIKISKANEQACIENCSFTTQNIVFVIGESFIKGHSCLYGYQHETNPHLLAEQVNGNLFVFTDVISHTGETAGCMQMFYSTKSIDDGKVWEEQPLFPSIMKKAGYRVCLFDNQSTRSSGIAKCDYSTSYFINPTEIHNQCFDYRNDKVCAFDLDFIKKEMECITREQGTHTFTIFHLYGQHIQAKWRYPNTEEHTFFTADSIKRQDLEIEQRQKIADYDNATRYNDLVIYEILNIYRNKDAVVVYVADHGDCMYDDRNLTYGRVISSRKSDDAIKVLYEVPMMIWCSDKYKKNHPKIIERIQRSVDRPFMHDDICHVLFDIAGVNTCYYIPSRSVINDHFIPRQRIVNGGQYNYDENKFRLDKVQLRTKDN